VEQLEAPSAAAEPAGQVEQTVLALSEQADLTAEPAGHVEHGLQAARPPVE
jgi:hypothetical protein